MTFERFFVPLIDAVGLLADRQDEFVNKLPSSKYLTPRSDCTVGGRADVLAGFVDLVHWTVH
jgi:hypothetical protein